MANVATRKRLRRDPRVLADPDLARLTFHGAAGEVTGSCLLLETHRARVLIECGLIQGSPREEARNARRFPFDPAGLDAVVLTHAHIDHSGRLPKLVKDGYAGAVHATGGTCDLLRILLPDSAHIQEQDARFHSRRRLRRGKPALEPLYTTADARRAVERCAPCELGVWTEIAPGVLVRFRRAGHILGSSCVEVLLRHEGVERRLVISGDVGRGGDPLLRDPDPPERADLLVLESTYGDREHRSREETLDELAAILDDAQRRGGNVVVPVFAVGRAQEILHHIGSFEREGRIRPRPVFLDSPMAISVTEQYARHRESLVPGIAEAAREGRLPSPELLRVCRTPEESMALNDRRGIVVLAASGMCEAGRVTHHLAHNLGRRGSHVVIVGFQARGTLGRALVDGARKVRVLGERIAVRAKVHTVGGFSAHADRAELVRWAGPMLDSGARVALVHGEPDRREALRDAIGGRSRHPVCMPRNGAAIRFLRRGSMFELEGPQQSDRASRGG